MEPHTGPATPLLKNMGTFMKAGKAVEKAVQIRSFSRKDLQKIKLDRGGPPMSLSYDSTKNPSPPKVFSQRKKEE